MVEAVVRHKKHPEVRLFRIIEFSYEELLHQEKTRGISFM
jgi:hypothetical protein